MKRSLRISALVLAAGVAALPGCATKAPIPLAENFDLTVQPKVRSAGHWDLLSNDVVTQTLASLKNVQVPANTPMVVGLPANPSQFDRGFREFRQGHFLLIVRHDVFLHPAHRAVFLLVVRHCFTTRRKDSMIGQRFS